MYAGGDGTFALTEDDGESLDYTNNKNVLTSALSWSDASKTFTWKKNGRYILMMMVFSATPKYSKAHLLYILNSKPTH